MHITSIGYPSLLACELLFLLRHDAAKNSFARGGSKGSNSTWLPYLFEGCLVGERVGYYYVIYFL